MHLTIQVSPSDCQSPSLWFWAGLPEAGAVPESQHNTPLTTSEPPWTHLLSCHTVKIKTTPITWLSPFITPAVCIHAFPLSHCTFQKQTPSYIATQTEELDNEAQVYCAEWISLADPILTMEHFIQWGTSLHPQSTPASWASVRRNYKTESR